MNPTVEIDYLPAGSIPLEKLTYVVIGAREEGKWIFVRHKERDSWELPAGHIEPGETSFEAAKRELFEETGYQTSNMLLLGSVHPNPAIQNNQCYTYLAKDVSLKGSQQQDEKEDIEVLLRPLVEIPKLILLGEITHALVLAAFYRFFMEYQDGTVL